MLMEIESRWKSPDTKPVLAAEELENHLPFASVPLPLRGRSGFLDLRLL